MDLHAEDWMPDQEETDFSLAAAVVHARSLEAELERTNRVLQGIALTSAVPGMDCAAELDDLRAQLSELNAIAVERRALRQHAKTLAADMVILRDQMLQMARQLAQLRQRWSSREISTAAQREILAEPAPSAMRQLAAVV